MTMPSVRSEPVRRASSRRAEVEREWSFTASTEPSEHDNVLVVYRLSSANLGLDDMVAEVARRSGSVEAVRWRRARTREYVTRLRDQLRLHVSNAELIIHADEADSDDRLQVIVTSPSGDPSDATHLEQDIDDRVQAISKRVWINWSESLRLTMATLNDLEQPA